MRRCLFLVFLLVLAGCGRNSFVGGRLDNFLAYYNTFYNAGNAFETGTKSLQQQNEAIDSDTYLTLYGQTDRVAQTKPFDEAIEKSADVLREHPNSKWVDDALLLIGKSYYHIENYIGAEQKFREVISLASSLEDEARFWLARTLIASEQYQEATDDLQRSLSQEDLSKRWEPQLRFLLADLYVQRQAWEEAATQLEVGLEKVRDDELASRAQFLLGQVYETLGRYPDAIQAFEETTRFHPYYELAYAAQINAIRIETKHGEVSKALDKLRRMERDDKNYANRAELAYLRAQIYQQSGRVEDALDAYYELLYDYDTGANITPVLGPIHYALAELYRDVDKNYPLAAAHFDTASTSLTTSISVGRGVSSSENNFTPGAITDSKDQARIFGTFAKAAQEVQRLDSLLNLGSMDEAAFEAFVLDLRKERAKTMAAQKQAEARLMAEQSFREGTFEPSRTGQPTAADNPGVTSAAGFLYYQDPIRVQQGLQEFKLRWGSRPLTPDWRRSAAARGISEQESTEASDSTATAAARTGSEALPEIDVSAVPRDASSQAKMRAQRALARYELGNVLFLSMNQADSAAVWYRTIVEEDPDEPVAQRAFYALAELQQALGDTLTARSLYQEILEKYPTSDFVDKVRERLGLNETTTAAADSTSLAEAAYSLAYADWQKGSFDTSFKEMMAVATRYASTETAPRALFAAGSIYIEWASRDNLSLFDPLPLSVSDSSLIASGLVKLPLAPEPAPPIVATSTDSTQVAPLENPVVAVETATPQPEPVQLETLLTHLTETYPQSPLTPRARRILSALSEQRETMLPPADTTAQPLPAEPVLADASQGGGDDPTAVAQQTETPPEEVTPGWAQRVNAMREEPEEETIARERRLAARREAEREGREEPIRQEVIPVQQEEPVQPVQQEEPVQPVEEEEPVQRVEEEEPVQPVQQEEPVQPVQEEEPVQPVQEEEPVQPVQEEEPVQPVQEEEPVQPVQQEEPVQPVQQEEPVQPVQEEEPVQPVQQEEPVQEEVSSVEVKDEFEWKGMGWTIVSGTYATRQEAHAAIGQLNKKKGVQEYPVRLILQRLGSKVRYRVIVGVFRTQAEAVDAQGRLGRAGLVKTQVLYHLGDL